MNLTCSKLYPEIPFAHRQWRHEGHCSLIHGHNWSFEFEFGCEYRDVNGFVVDFGGLGELKKFVQTFDHALVLSDSDPKLAEIQALGVSRIITLPDTSCEGLAEYLLSEAVKVLGQTHNGRVWVSKVTVYEDSHNKATASI